MREFTGALGDLGTFVPIFITLVAVNGLNPTAILVVAGILYIVSALYYKVPVPVQPLKAMAAIAVTLGLGSAYIQAASIIIGVVLFIIASGNLAKFLPRIFTQPIIKGMQLGVGLLLMKTALVIAFKPIGQGHAVSAQVLNLFHFHGVSFSIPSWDIFLKSFWLLVLPQLPLTLGNAIVGTCDIAKKHFGGRADKVKARSLCLDLGIANVISGFISGSVPLCHGSSGMTAHIVFGARTGRATAITGILFLICAILLGAGSQVLFRQIPNFVLGTMLLYVGFRHSMLICVLKEKKEFLMAFSIGAIGLLTGNLTLALCLGLFFWHISAYLFPVFVGVKIGHQ